MRNGDEGRVASSALGRRYVLLAAVLWSVSGVATKSLSIDPQSIAFYRSLFAGLALLPFTPRSRREFRPIMVPLALTFGAMTGLFIGAIKATSAANAIFLQCTATTWMALIGAVVLRERPDRRSLAGIAMSTAGIALILAWGYKGPGEGRGIALGLASGLAYAIVVVGMRGLRRLDPIWLSAVNNLGGSLALGAWMVATQSPIATPTAPQALGLIGFGVVQMAIPYALFARGLREIGASEAGLIGLLEPVLNPVWVYLFLAERPTDITLYGGLFLLAGMACRYLPVRTTSAKARTEAEV